MTSTETAPRGKRRKITPAPRGLCGECGRTFALRREGDRWVNRLHRGLDDKACPGTGELPVPCGTVVIADPVVKAYVVGDPSTVVARRFGVSTNAVLKRVRNAGHEVRPVGGDHGQQHPLTDDAVQAVEMYVAGGSTTTIAEQFGVSRQTILTWVRKAGYQVRPPGPLVRPGMGAGEVAKAVEMLVVGDVSTKQIAEAFGVRAKTVRKWVRAATPKDAADRVANG